MKQFKTKSLALALTALALASFNLPSAGFASTESDQALAAAPSIKSYISRLLMSDAVVSNIKQVYLPLAQKAKLASVSSSTSTLVKQKALQSVLSKAKHSLDLQKGQMGFTVLSVWINPLLDQFEESIQNKNFESAYQLSVKAEKFLSSLI